MIGSTWQSVESIQGRLVQLNEAYVLRVLPEALAAHVQPVFADQTMAVGADTARAGTLAELPWVTPVELLVTCVAFRRPTRKEEQAGRQQFLIKRKLTHITFTVEKEEQSQS